MDDAIIRAAEEHELTDVAELRWQWTLENGGTPATSHEDFVRGFLQWARENATSHHCVIAVRGERIVGMAWLAVLARVPTPNSLVRECGDVQSVYVTAAERNAGLGSRMIDALLHRAQQLRLVRVTVHSSTRARDAYRRRGFDHSPSLLQVEPNP